MACPKCGKPSDRISLCEECAKLEGALKEQEVNNSIEHLVGMAKTQLNNALNQRFENKGLKHRFEISEPKIPEKLTPDHIKGIEEILGGNANLTIIPKLEEVHNLDSEYQEAMYPNRPEVFDKPVGNNIEGNFGSGKDRESWGQAFMRSMRKELSHIGGSLVVYETTLKPDVFIDVEGDIQTYGRKNSNVGSEKGEDPLSSVFGVNRFRHSWDKIKEKLLPNLKKQIEAKFKSMGLEIPNFEVVLCPAFLFNQETNISSPQNALTDTRELTSTVLTDKEGKDTGHRFRVGSVSAGGVSDFRIAEHDKAMPGTGFRVAIVFQER